MGVSSTALLVVLAGSWLGQVGVQADLGPRPHALDLGFSGGAFMTSGSYGLVADRGSADLDRAGLSFMLRLSYSPFTFLGVEAEAGHIAVESGTYQETSLYALRGHVIAQYPARFAPFVVAGGGLLGLTGAEESMGSDQSPEFHWGGGLKFFAMPSVVARIDARHTMALGDGGMAQHFEVLAGIAFTLASADP